MGGSAQHAGGEPRHRALARPARRGAGRGHAGTDVRSKSYATRRALLEDLLGRQLSHGIVLMPMTTDLAVARTWMHDNISPGVEGVVLKHLAHFYRPGGGRPCLKISHQADR